MNKEQREDIFVIWSQYNPGRKKEIVREYLAGCSKHYSQEGFLNFIKDRIEIEGDILTPQKGH